VERGPGDQAVPFALESHASLVHVPLPEVPQNGVASRWSTRPADS
jgi:hypothetical protein